MRFVALSPEPDWQIRPLRLADECVDIGPAQAAKSYLNRDAVLQAALNSGADASRQVNYFNVGVGYKFW